MAKEMEKKTKRFSLYNSDAIEENERILEAGSQQRKENRANGKQNEKQNGVEAVSTATAPAPVSTSTSASVPTPAPATTAPAVSAPVAPAVMQSAKKATNGIVVDVPLDDYIALMQMKVLTRRTLKDLALQAIHEFVERNK